MNTIKKFGSELQLGDMLDTWFGRQRLLEKLPYNGKIDFSRQGGAWIARFDSGKEMTMTNDWDLYTVIK